MPPFRGLCLLCALSIAPPLTAAPWPRAPGTGFSAAALDGNQHASSWIEYGLSPGRWISFESDLPLIGAAEVALSFNQALPDLQGWKASLSLGAVARITRTPAPAIRHRLSGFAVAPGFQFGAAIGRGFETPMPGWFSLGARLRQIGEVRRVKAEVTLGLRPARRLSLIGQLQLATEARSPRHLALEGTAVWHLTDALSLTMGLRQPLTGSTRRPLGSLGTWLQF